MFIADWCTPLGTEPFEWQRRRMEGLLPSLPDRAGSEKRERRTPRKKEQILPRTPNAHRKAAGMAAG